MVVVVADQRSTTRLPPLPTTTIYYYHHCYWQASTSAACLTFAYRAMRPQNRAHVLNRENLVLGCVATGSCCYWMWGLYVPLLCYALNFAQDYAEVVTAQA